MLHLHHHPVGRFLCHFDGGRAAVFRGLKDYVMAASGSKRKAQEKLVDAILPAKLGKGGTQPKGRTLVAPEKSNVQALSP
jgi:hypothetical protein